MAEKRRQKTWTVPRIRDPRYPGLIVRIAELERGGTLYVVRMVDGRQKVTSLRLTRADLGATPQEQEKKARALALDVIAELAKGGSIAGPRVSASQPATDLLAVGGPLTLGKLVDLYEKRGSLSASPNYMREQVNKLRRMEAFFGADRTVVSLSGSDVDAWVQYR